MHIHTHITQHHQRIASEGTMRVTLQAGKTIWTTEICIRSRILLAFGMCTFFDAIFSLFTYLQGLLSDARLEWRQQRILQYNQPKKSAYFYAYIRFLELCSCLHCLYVSFRANIPKSHWMIWFGLIFVFSNCRLSKRNMNGFHNRHGQRFGIHQSQYRYGLHPRDLDRTLPKDE